MSVQRRIERLEQRHGEAVDAAYRRLLAQLSDEELPALAGPEDLWSGLSDADLAIIAETGRPPMVLQMPEALLEYEPPAWVLRRVWELATPTERRLLKLEQAGEVEPPEA